MNQLRPRGIHHLSVAAIQQSASGEGGGGGGGSRREGGRVVATVAVRGSTCGDEHVTHAGL